MSVYSEMLRMALDHDPTAGTRPLAELISDLLSRRAVVMTAATGRGAADRIGDTLSYDVALARLCEHLSIDHGLAGDAPVPALRRRAEMRLAAHLPSIADSLGGGPPEPDGSASRSGPTPTRRGAPTPGLIPRGAPR